MNTSSVYKMLKDDILNVFNFQQCLLFAYRTNHI